MPALAVRLAVLIDAGFDRRGLKLEAIARLIGDAPARRFRIAHKGRIAVGADADLILLDLSESRILTKADLFQRHPISPYLGAAFRGVVRRRSPPATGARRKVLYTRRLSGVRTGRRL